MKCPDCGNELKTRSFKTNYQTVLTVCKHCGKLLSNFSIKKYSESKN